MSEHQPIERMSPADKEGYGTNSTPTAKAWTEAQIDRHLHLWEHRHGPDSPEAGIVRQLRAERDKAGVALIECRDEIDGYVRQEYPHDHPVQERCRQRDFAANPARIALAALPTTQETPHD